MVLTIKGFFLFVFFKCWKTYLHNFTPKSAGDLQVYQFTSALVVDKPPLHRCRPTGHHIWNPTVQRGRPQRCLLCAFDLQWASQGAAKLLNTDRQNEWTRCSRESILHLKFGIHAFRPWRGFWLKSDFLFINKHAKEGVTILLLCTYDGCNHSALPSIPDDFWRLEQIWLISFAVNRTPVYFGVQRSKQWNCPCLTWHSGKLHWAVTVTSVWYQ